MVIVPSLKCSKSKSDTSTFWVKWDILYGCLAGSRRPSFTAGDIPGADINDTEVGTPDQRAETHDSAERGRYCWDWVQEAWQQR